MSLALLRGPCTPLASCGLTSSATGVPRGRHFEAHLCRSGLVGFTTSTDRQRIDAVLRRADKFGLGTSAAPSDFPTFEALCSSADDELFTKTSTFSNHILHAFLPSLSTASQCYSLRRRTHSFQLPGHSTHFAISLPVCYTKTAISFHSLCFVCIQFIVYCLA